MYVSLKITADVFEAVKAKMIAAKKGDYYETPAGARVAIKDCSGLQALVQGAAIKPRYADDAVTISAGYTVKDNSAIYCTSAGNLHGMCKADDGYFAFYFGRRSRAGDLWSALLDNGVRHPDLLEVADYSTEGPADMKWWEGRTDYVLRQDDLYVASVIAGPSWDEDSEWCRDIIRCLHWTPERLARVRKLTAIQKRANELAYRRERAES